jgi:PAS domain S-box-containing protein
MKTMNQTPEIETVPAASPVTAYTLNALDELPVPYIQMDMHGIITHANRATLALHPPERGSLIGRMAWELMATDEKDPSCAAYFLLMETGEDPPVVYRSLYDRSGHFRTYQMHRSLIRDAQGKPAGMHLICWDVTESTSALEEARSKSRRLESLFESVPEAILVTDTVGFITSVNSAAEELLGWKASQLNGELIEKGLPVLSYSPVEPLPDGEEFNHFTTLAVRTRGIAKILDGTGKELEVEISTSPMIDSDNNTTIGVVGVLRKCC